MRHKLRDQLQYGWVIFALSFTNLVVEGAVKNTVPVVYVALRDSFHWSASATSGIFSLAGLVGGLSAPFLGRLLDRWGGRWLFPLGGALILLGWGSSSFATSLWHLFFFYSVVATIGENSISSFTTTANLSPWFPRTRGRILGLADIGNPLGAVLFLPLAQWLILTFGWQVTFRLLGVVFFVLLVPGNLFLQRRPPHQQDQAVTGEAIDPTDAPRTPPEAPDVPPPGHASVKPTATVTPTGYRQIWRRRPVWFLVLARLLASLGTHVTSVHLVAFFVNSGYDPMLAASAIAGVGLVSVVGRPLSGALSDIVGRELMYTVGLGMHISAIVLMLILGNGQSMLPILLFIALSGLSDGIAGLIVGAKAGDLFPATELGLVMGLTQMGRGLGIMVGPLVGGLLFDLQGNYLLAFVFAVILVTLAIGSMWCVRWTSQRPSTD
jgi:MFS family permease